METKKVTNWINWNEWKRVIDDAYNEEEDVESYRRAFNHILIWECRDSNIPVALMCLKELLIAKLFSIDKKTCSIDNIYAYQSCLSMNIVRFVNLITEPYQSHVFAKPIKTVANEIGIPDWIVNLRHNATHYNLPSIEILENARDYLFQWLKEYYIKTYREIPIEESILQNVKSYIEELLNDYMNTRYKNAFSKAKKQKFSKEEKKLDEKLKQIMNQFRTETFEILLENGFMIPTKEQLNAIGIVVEEFIDDEQLKIPKLFLNIWLDFLLYCNENNLIGSIFEQFVNTYRQENDNLIKMDPLREKFFLSWIICFINFNSNNERAKNIRLSFEFSARKILSDVLKGNPSKYTILFMSEISKIPIFKNEIGELNLDKLLTMARLTYDGREGENQCVSNDDSMEEVDYDTLLTNFAEMFEMNDLNDERECHKKRTETQSLRWQLHDDPNWNSENLKLGLVEGQNYETLNLNLSQFNRRKNEQNEHEISVNEADVNTEKAPLDGAFNLFTLNRHRPEKIELFRKDLIRTYWELNN